MDFDKSIDCKLRVLMYLNSKRLEENYISKVGKHTGHTFTALLNSVNELESAGFLIKDKSGRKTYLKLTRKGNSTGLLLNKTKRLYNETN